MDELVRIAEAIGLPGHEPRAVLATGSYAAAVDADWQRSRELGVTSVPTHLCAVKESWGSDSTMSSCG
jgi:predicted DsbA family dithiol-disulfide isomerase